MKIRRLDSAETSFDEALGDLLKAPADDMAGVADSVGTIIESVKRRGDDAIIELTERFDGFSVASASDLEISRARQQQALGSLDPLVAEALAASVERVRDYHQRQKRAFGNGADWEFTDAEGNRLGQLVRGMQKIGIYAPGGKAAYPSTVLMTAIPARVAGVEEISLVVPTPGGEVNDAVLAAAYLCDVDRVFTIGGAQAIAALAYGTALVPRVDKIVGPGNIYVATAKKMVFGDVGIDMIAGPSEVVIVADGSARASWLAMDMFAQSEHDEMAQAILISMDGGVLDAVADAMKERIGGLSRKDIVRESLEKRGALVKVRDLNEAVDIVNRIAPEHLEIATVEPELVLEKIRHAGAIFLGNYSAEVVGDYTAGPSHVLPTSGTARFGSPLGVYDFQVRSSIVQCSAKGAVSLSRDAAIIARSEGLDAHAESAEARVEG